MPTASLFLVTCYPIMSSTIFLPHLFNLSSPPLVHVCVQFCELQLPTGILATSLFFMSQSNSKWRTWNQLACWEPNGTDHPPNLPVARFDFPHLYPGLWGFHTKSFSKFTKGQSGELQTTTLAPDACITDKGETKRRSSILCDTMELKPLKCALQPVT